MSAERAFASAPAKVNLTLEVTGKRPDGYHELQSLVIFMGEGDRLSAEPADDLTLEITGPFAQGLSTGGDNLVLLAARLLDGETGAKLLLEKNLPVAAGIGGGSSDAAAALKLLSNLWGKPLPLAQDSLALGADLPVCLSAAPSWVTGIGEIIEPLEQLPAFSLVLVNPGQALETGPVFQALEGLFSAPAPPPGTFEGFADLLFWLKSRGNDLQAPALTLCPVIADVLSALKGEGAALARMSGSGATCFGIFQTQAEALAAAQAIKAKEPHWWVSA